MALYAYCLSDDMTGSMLEGVTGVAGAVPRLVPCGAIAAVVSDFEGERVSIERESVFAHERVVQRVLKHVTPLPFRFGTLVTKEKLEGYVEANRDVLIKSMERVRGRVEMSVKIIWSTEDVRREGLKTEGADAAMEEDEPQAAGKGTAYLAARRREIMGDKLLKERAEELAAWLSERIGEAANDREVQVRPDESLVVRAAFLVERGRLHDYQERVEEARAARASLRFLTSGPWPPYSFSNINP
ncbi:MAG TPA: GvpL/GvpF family gas vesicle protein [Pyrinomonadaceae bacterium]|jgi:hypothetical protein|nr:GvpL/GvpF family gas vesicle protein [Pyrinomonadaceae bacterium]